MDGVSNISHKKLKPMMIAADGTRYRLVLLKVMDTYDDRPEVSGMKIPAEMLFIDDNDVCEIIGGERFVTAYVPEVVFGSAPRPPKD